MGHRPHLSKPSAGRMSEDEDAQGLDLDRDEPLIEKWRHLKKTRVTATGTNASGEMGWWLVVAEEVVLRAAPNDDSEVVHKLKRGDPIYGVRPSDTWLAVRPHKKPSQLDVMRPTPSWHDSMPESCPREAWVTWRGQGSATMLKPMNHLDKLLQYRSTAIVLPPEAVQWTVSEVDVFLGSVGFVRPGRESAMMRCSKRLLRAVRGGAAGLEYRVDERGTSGGVFACGHVSKGSWVEVCPILEVDLKLRNQSQMLQRITLHMVGEKERYGIVLGYGKLYSVSRTPSLHWSYRGDDEVVLWAAEEVHEGRELSVDFTAPPQPLHKAGKGPASYQAPTLRGAGKLQSAGYVIHGNSGIHGRGVFTTKEVAKGDIIESCPALELDEHGREAMFSYRWGLKNDPTGEHYYLPLGLGSLYNHSEQNTAMGSLDVKRSVLEFIATRDMHSGQEVLVSYGDTYFDEDYEGHRKSELLHIEAPPAEGNLELQKLIELQRALIRGWTTDEFLKELRERADERQRQVASGNLATKKDQKQKTVHALYMEIEQPILERFGYSNGMQGAFQMSEDLTRVTRGLDHSHEAVRNNIVLGTLSHLFDPPPPEYWDTLPLDLVLLGTEDEDAPEVLSVQVPSIAPAGFVRFMISARYPQTGAYGEFRVKLATHGGEKPYREVKDSEPLPRPKQPGGKHQLFVYGVGDTWPESQRLRRPDGEEELELTDWQLIWRWLGDPFAQILANNWPGGSYKIAGTWDNFKCNDMEFDGQSFIFWTTLSEQKWDSFQILKDGNWDLTLYPDVRDGSPWVRHTLKGPDKRGHGKNWTIGRHKDDAGDPGTVYKIELQPDEKGLPGKVHWTRFGRGAKAKEARLESKKHMDWLASQKISHELQEAIRAEEMAVQFKLEWARRKVPAAPVDLSTAAGLPPVESNPVKDEGQSLAETRQALENRASFDFDALDALDAARQQPA